MPSRDFSQFNIPEGDLVFSQTTISSLELSPCRWLYGPHQSLKLEPSEAMTFGTVMHAILEAFVKGEINHFELISPQTASKIGFEVALEEGIDLKEKMPDAGRRAAWFLELAEGAQAWYSQWWVPIGRDLDPLSVEEQFAMNYQPGVWFVTGGIDLILKDYSLVDWKTAGNGWTNGQGSGNQQKEAYAMLVENKYGRLPSKMTFVVLNRSKYRWEEFEAKITPQSVQAYRARLDGWIQYMLNPFHLCTPSEGKKRGWWARPDWNDVIDRCPSCRHLGDEYDNKERKDKTW